MVSYKSKATKLKLKVNSIEIENKFKLKQFLRGTSRRFDVYEKKKEIFRSKIIQIQVYFINFQI